MIDVKGILNLPIKKRYEYMLLLVQGQLKSENDFIANLSNISAIIKSALEETNWVGFYLYDGNELVLGPFQGMPACNRIKIGAGVCGNAVALKQTLRIDNVHTFDGHIACDSASNSEIVIPLIKNDKIIGVLDIDSPSYNRFSEMDQEYLEKTAKLILEYI